MNMWTDWFGGYGAMPWMFFGPVMMLIFLGVCVALGYLMLHAGARRDRGPGRAIEILRERFARGEIDQAEFEARRRLLRA
jgi:putative membrane protein